MQKYGEKDVVGAKFTETNWTSRQGLTVLSICSIRHSHVLWDSRRLTGLVAMVAVICSC